MASASWRAIVSSAAGACPAAMRGGSVCCSKRVFVLQAVQPGQALLRVVDRHPGAHRFTPHPQVGGRQLQPVALDARLRQLQPGVALGSIRHLLHDTQCAASCPGRG